MTEEKVRGIDVSHYQGDINWPQVAKAGIKFAFIKALDGVRNDPMFHMNWRGAREAGLRRGAYHYFRAQQDSERQAQSIIAMLAEDPGELPVVLDFESRGDIAAEQALQGAERWMKLLEQEIGCRPILYTGPAFWNSELNNTASLAEYPLWIAHYTAAREPRIPTPWAGWTFWQYSEQGTVAGIRVPVDPDRFNGNEMELDRLGVRIQKKSMAINS